MGLNAPRLAAIALAGAVAVAALGTPGVALAHDYRYWFGGAQVKQYPTTAPPASAPSASNPTSATLAVAAASAEAEGRNLMLRATAGELRDVWIEPSDLVKADGPSVIPAGRVSVYKVGYVKVSRASYGFHGTRYEPDPLIPMKLVNGERLGWQGPGRAMNTFYRRVANNTTQPFYVLFSVPDGTPAGVYTGTLTVSAVGSDGDDVDTITIPTRVTVYPFSIAKRNLRTSFGVNLNRAMRSGTSDVGKSTMWLRRNDGDVWNETTETTGFHADQVAGWLRYMSEHRISPETLGAAFETKGYAPGVYTRSNYLNDYLGTGAASTFAGDRLGINIVRMPEYENFSYTRDPRGANYSKAKRYYQALKSGLGSYASRAIVYPIDEPGASKRGFIETYATYIHRWVPGVKFFVTTDPITMKYKPLKGVDIYGHKLHFFYRDYSKWVAPLRRRGKGVWIYSHAGSYQAQVPNYLIDGPLPDVRANGWFAYHTNAGGLLYFDIAAWRPNPGSPSYRDPYKTPLSYSKPPYYANGDGSLVYPGYYPDYGLIIKGAPPVGSLRMEALRDGIEDYEYVRLLEKKTSRTTALTYVGKIVSKRKVGVKSSGKPTFPAYAHTQSAYDSARASIAARLAP